MGTVITFIDNRFISGFISGFFPSPIGSGFDLRKFVSRGQDVEAGTFDLRFSRRKDNQNIGVHGESSED